MVDFLPKRFPPGTTMAISGRCRIFGFIISHSNAAAQEVMLYEGANSSGTMRFSFVVNPAMAPYALFFPDNIPIVFENGFYIETNQCDVLMFATER